MASRTSRLTIALSSTKARVDAGKLSASFEKVAASGTKSAAAAKSAAASYAAMATASVNATAASKEAALAANATASSYKFAAQAASAYVAALSAGSVINDLQRLQSVNSRLSELTGDLAGQQQFLKSTAAELSAEYLTLADGYSKLLPLYDAGLLTLAQTQEITRGLANVQAAAGASSVQLGQTLFGLAQGLSAGTLRAEELNQITEPLPGLLQALDRAAGLAAGGFRQLVNEGEVTSEMLRDTLTKALATYEGAAAARSENIQQVFNRTRNAYLEAVEAFETPISSALVPVAGGIALAFEALEENAQGVTIAITAAGAALTANFAGNAVNRLTAFAVAQSAIGDSITALASKEVQLAQAKNVSAAAELKAAEATAANATAKLAAVNQTARYLAGEQQLAFVATEVAAAEKASAIATAQLTAAQNAASGSAAKLAAAQAAVTTSARAMAVAQRAATGAMALVGGPVGLALLAAAGVAYLATRQSDAEKAAVSLKEAMEGLNKAYEQNATAASNSADATIEAQRANIAALTARYEELKAARDEILGGAEGPQTVGLTFQMRELETQITAAKTALDRFINSNDELKEKANLDAVAESISASLAKINRDTIVSADNIEKWYNELFPNEQKIDELSQKLEQFEAAFRQGVITDPAEINRIRAAIQERINDLSGFNEGQEAAARKAEEYAKRIAEAVDEALPDEARTREQEAQLKLLRDEFNKGGEQAELYGRALAALESKYETEQAERATEAVKKFTEAITRNIDDPFEGYRQDIKLLTDALDELPDKANEINLALSNLDFSIEADLTVVPDARNAETAARQYQIQLDALQAFHAEREISEDRAQANILALAQSYASQMREIYNEQYDDLLAFRSTYEERPDQAGIDLTVSYDGAKAQAAAIKDAQERANALADIEQTYQDRVTEIVRAGEATRAQLEEASGADRLAGLINRNKTEIDAVSGLVESILSIRASREKAEADQALANAKNLATEAEEARRVYERTGLEQDRLLAEQAERRAAIAEESARREFEQQKKAQLQQARLSQLLAIMNAYATGGNWLTGLAFAATAGIATQQVIDQIKAQQFNGGSTTLSNTTSSNSQPYTLTANQQPGVVNNQNGTTERVIIVGGSFRTEDEAIAEGMRYAQVAHERGWVTYENGQPDYRNVPKEIRRLDG